MPGQGVLRLPRHAGAHLCDAAGNARAGGSVGAHRPVLHRLMCATRTLPPLSLTDMLCRRRQNAPTRGLQTAKAQLRFSLHYQ